MLILINENDQDINKVILEEDDTQNDIRIPIGLISHINAKGEGLPKPGKIYAASPGTLFITEEEKRKADELGKTDVVMSQKAIISIWEGMTGGTEVPDYMKYLQ